MPTNFRSDFDFDNAADKQRIAESFPTIAAIVNEIDEFEAEVAAISGTTSNTFTVDADSVLGKITIDVALGAADKELTLTNAALTDDRVVTFPDADIAVSSDVTTGGNVVPVDVTANGIGLDVDDIDGNGLLPDGSGHLNVDLQQLAAAVIDPANDSIAIIDADAADGSRQETWSDAMVASAGDGLTAAAGVMAVQPDSTTGGNVVPLDVTANGVGLDVDDIDGNGLLPDGSGHLNVSILDLAEEVFAPATDTIAFVDADDNITKRDQWADVTGLIAGDGIQAATGVLAVDVSDFAGTGLEDDGSENLRLATQGNGIAGGAGSTLSVAPDSTTGGTTIPVTVGANGVGVDVANIAPAVVAAVVDVAADSILISDADAAGVTKVESVADLATAQAGSGMAATNGVFSVPTAHTQGTDTGTTSSSFVVDSDAVLGRIALAAVAGAGNFQMDLQNAVLTANRTVTFPDANITVAQQADVDDIIAANTDAHIFVPAIDNYAVLPDGAAPGICTEEYNGAGLAYVQRTAATGTDTMFLPVPTLILRDAANKGHQVNSVDIIYDISGGSLTGFTATLYKVVPPAVDGLLPVASLVATTPDLANPETLASHKLRLTVDTPAYHTASEQLGVDIVIVGDAVPAAVTKIYGCVWNMTEALVD